MNPAVKILIDLAKYQSSLRVTRKGFIFDPFRKKEVAITPEEMVRQLLLEYLVREKKYRRSLVAVEKGLVINGMERRFDAVVFDRSFRVQILIECKAPGIAVSDAVFRQIAQYNEVLRAELLLVSNGLESYCCRMNYQDKSWLFLPEIPDVSNVNNSNNL